MPASRFPCRAASVALAALAMLSCGREPTGAARASAVAASLNLGPLFQTNTASNNVTNVRVTIYLVNPAAAANSADRRRELKSVTYALTDTRNVVETDNDVTIKFEFPLQGANAVYEVEGGAYDDAGTLLYSVPAVQFTEKQVTSGGSVTVTSTAVYVGPGSNAAKVTISPRSLSMKPGEQQTLTATAYDAAGNPIPQAPFIWRSSNPQVANVSDKRSGVVTAAGLGSATLTVAIEGTQITDAVPVTVSLTPTGIIVVQGGGQTAAAGVQLPTPVRVRVVSGSTGVPGVSVTFAVPPTQGGSVSPAQVTTDNNGEAETRWTLSSSTGTQTLNASAAGLQTSVTATASAPPVRVTILSTSPASISVGGSSVITVEVRATNTSALVAGQPVTFSASGLGVAVNPTTATTNSSGQASTTFTSTSAGSFGITASAGTSSALATVTVIDANVVTQLVKVSGDAQTVRIGATFGAPVVVEARNALGQPVGGVAVDFSTSTSPVRQTTGTDGRASMTFGVSPQALPGVGSILVTLVSNPGISVTFTYTAIP